jgi:hypothetical protein
LSATRELIAALVAGGMDAASAAGLVARAAVEMTGVLTKNIVPSMSTGLSTGQGGENRALEKRRAWDRDRKRREREARKASDIASANSTGFHRTSTGLPPENADVFLTVEDKKEGLSVGKERKKGSRLLSGTRVSDEQRTAAIECGCPPDRVDAVWTEFVDYWSDIPGQKGCKLTWNGTWRNRVKQIFGKANGNGTSNHRADPAAGRATAREAQHVAAMGGAALRYLQEGKSAGSGGETSSGPGSAEVFDFGKRAENAR